MIRFTQGPCMGALIFFSITVVAQVKDTIRENQNYQYRSTFTDTGKSGKNYHYLGFQANQLLRQLIGSAGGGDNPFTVTYSFNSVSRGRGMSFGLGFSSRTIEDEDKAINLKRTTKTSNLAFRVGYEWKKAMGKRWIGGIGADLFRDGGSSETTTTQSGGSEIVTTSKTNGLGLGGRLSLLFNVNGRIYLGTETSMFFKSLKTTSKTENSFGGGTNETKQTDKTFTLSVPTALFLVVRF